MGAKPRRTLRSAWALCLALLCVWTGAAARSEGAFLDIAMVCSADLRMLPLEVMERDPQTMMDLVYESVVALDDDRRPQGELAASWTPVGDGSTWVFTLHDEIYFHDGRKLTAHDVIATLNKIKALADEGKGQYRQTVKVLSGWEADGDLSFRVRAAQPNYMVLYAMNFPVLPRNAVDQECPPGTGPYRIEYYQPGGMFMLSGNQNWWKRAPYFQTITAYCYEKDSEALIAFQAETVDVLMTRSLSATRYRGVIGSAINSYDYGTQQLECLLFNNYAAIFRNADFRRALCHAIDKSRLATAVYQNIATTTDNLVMPGSYLYNKSTEVSKAYFYDPQLANSLLNGLGYTQYDTNGVRYKEENGKTTTLELRLFYYDEPGSNLRKEAAGMIADMLAQVGIRVRTSLYTFEDAKKKLDSGDYDLFLCAYNFGAVPDLDYLFGKDGNYARYSSQDMSALVKKLRNAHEEADFESAWMEIQAQFALDQPFLPLYWRGGLLLMRGPYLAVRDIREYELLRGLADYGY